MPQQALRCTVEVQIEAVTCPGADLLTQHDIYLSGCMMGQYQKTQCVPPVFPLSFRRKLLFSKRFSDVVDPGDIARLLQCDTTSFELIQLVPPEGDILATAEQNTRDFLYPEPELAPRSPSAQRELLMKRSISFPGISPRVEFTTRSIIEECDVKDSRLAVTASSRPSAERPARRTETSGGYNRPTVASLTRALSPYTYRRMCQLSEDAGQRLRHLRLGPHTFKKETASQPPFVVAHSPSVSFIEPSSPWHSSSSSNRSRIFSPSATHAAVHSAVSLPNSRTSTPAKARPSSKTSHAPQRAPAKHQHRSPPPHSTPASSRTSPPRHRSPPPHSTPASSRTSPPRHRSPPPHSTPASSRTSPPRHRSPPPHSTPASAQSPVLRRSSLRERFHSDPSSPSNWTEIHRRVQRILRTHGTRCKLSFDEDYRKGFSHRVATSKSCQDSLCDSQLPPESATLPCEARTSLANDGIQSYKTPEYTGNAHRVTFEDSLTKIYKNLYRNASGTS
ncbi:spermatogenesis-associated protein 6 [Denticeps clupeoides]|uniref:Spermatogenesis-associated protein 6 N-terminal domain-containing protein n=1 Tax=Denticeps clupeoides TaxID=299321 RepID=A0AAY4BWN5_9TELE|nr:spermatogenesis-associated protein 6 [Denticeps clupeoides]XP_028857745.1 spermatogenesis-associated protein 6 [Denticeps clupeoides]